MKIKCKAVFPSIKIERATFLPFAIYAALLVAELFAGKLTFLRYADEITTIFFIAYILLRIIKNSVAKEYFSMLWRILALFILGLAANLIYSIQTNTIVILFDVISVFKLFICFCGFQMLFSTNGADKILRKFYSPAKIFLVVSSICGIISLFVDIGMRGGGRYGLWTFRLIYPQAHLFAMMVLVAIMIVKESSRTEKNFVFYLILSIMLMLLNLKGPSIIWAAIVVALLLYMRKRKKMSLAFFAVLGVVTALLGGYQIQNYILRSDVPRSVFYQFGWRTANAFFPLGAGFATFGSDMAAKHYSPLYVQYGFPNRYGMSPTMPYFLLDTYWPMIWGQFGWFGFILFASLFVSIFIAIQKSSMNGSNKALLISVFFYSMLHALGSSSLNTSAAIILYMTIGLILKKYSCADSAH